MIFRRAWGAVLLAQSGDLSREIQIAGEIQMSTLHDFMLKEGVYP